MKKTIIKKKQTEIELGQIALKHLMTIHQEEQELQKQIKQKSQTTNVEIKPILQKITNYLTQNNKKKKQNEQKLEQLQIENIMQDHQITRLKKIIKSFQKFQSDVKQWVDPNKQTYKNLLIKGDKITHNGKFLDDLTYIFGKNVLGQSYCFSATFSKINTYVAVGIIDRKNRSNLLLYYSDGTYHDGQGIQESEEGFNEGDQVMINFYRRERQKGQINWEVRGKVRLKLEIPKSDNIEWVPYIELNYSSDSVTIRQHFD